MGIDEINTIRSKINGKSFSWTAGSTSVSDLSREAKMRHLGLIVPEEEKKGIREMMDKEAARLALPGNVAIYPAKWDWRNVSGNWTTGIRDQKQCGSCVAFATVATIESNLEIFKRDPNLNP
ncbi:MAG TPA: C1 family peptidase, partial [Methanothrix sp.]